LERVHFLIDALEIDSGVSISQLVESIADYREESIIIEAAILPCFISGFTIRSEQGPYLIVYDQYRSGEAKDLVLTHELAHILSSRRSYCLE
jgi:Zn-dependent peptidase ImmA (M78 family)